MTIVEVKGRYLRPDLCDFEVKVEGWSFRLAQMPIGCLRPTFTTYLTLLYAAVFTVDSSFDEIVEEQIF